MFGRSVTSGSALLADGYDSGCQCETGTIDGKWFGTVIIKLWRGSSVGQSSGFISRVSAVQIRPPLFSLVREPDEEVPRPRHKAADRKQGFRRIRDDTAPAILRVSVLRRAC